VKNRESAQESRNKKRSQVGELQREMGTLRDANTALSESNSALQSSVEKLQRMVSLHASMVAVWTQAVQLGRGHSPSALSNGVLLILLLSFGLLLPQLGLGVGLSVWRPAPPHQRFHPRVLTSEGVPLSDTEPVCWEERHLPVRRLLELQDTTRLCEPSSSIPRSSNASVTLPTVMNSTTVDGHNSAYQQFVHCSAVGA